MIYAYRQPIGWKHYLETGKDSTVLELISSGVSVFSGEMEMRTMLK